MPLAVRVVDRGRRPAGGRPPGRCRATGGRCPAPPRRRPTRSGNRPEPPTSSASSTIFPAKPRRAAMVSIFSRQGVQILVGDPDDHPGLVDQFGDDGAQHGLRLRGALPPRQFGQQLAGDGGADPDHALALAGRRVGGALHDVFKLVGQPLQRRRNARHRRRFGRGLAVGETVGIAVLVRLEQVGRFEDRLRRRGRFFRFGRGRRGLRHQRFGCETLLPPPRHIRVELGIEQKPAGRCHDRVLTNKFRVGKFRVGISTSRSTRLRPCPRP